MSKKNARAQSDSGLTANEYAYQVFDECGDAIGMVCQDEDLMYEEVTFRPDGVGRGFTESDLRWLADKCAELTKALP